MKYQLLNYTLYNVWANERVIDFLRKNVNEDQINREITSSFSSIRTTLFHIWDAENIWLERLNGTSPASWISQSFKGNINEAYSAVLAGSRGLAEYVESKDEHHFFHVLQYSRTDGNKYENVIIDVLQHCMNHSTFHRGQIITMLRQLGFTKLIGTDYITFCRPNFASTH